MPISNHQRIERIEKKPIKIFAIVIRFEFWIDIKKILKNSIYREYLVEKCDVS